MVGELHLLNVGIYTVPEASRLTRVSTGRIRRWLRGYHYMSRGKAYATPPVWKGQLEAIDGKLALTFLDLIEVRFVDVFLNRGFSWATLRKARAHAAELFKTTHPFSTQRFLTDGRSIFVELQPALIDIVRKQPVFEGIVGPFISQLEYDDNDQARRWRPMKERQVVLDPKRSFGQPIVMERGVPTNILATAAQSSPVDQVIEWFQVKKSEVQDAVAFEQMLAA